MVKKYPLSDVFKMLRGEWLSYKQFSNELNLYVLPINLSIFFFKRILKHSKKKHVHRDP